MPDHYYQDNFVIKALTRYSFFHYHTAYQTYTFNLLDGFHYSRQVSILSIPVIACNVKQWS